MGKITPENSYVDWRVYTECLDLIDNPIMSQYNHFEPEIMRNGSGLLFECQQEFRDKNKISELPLLLWVCFDKPVIYQEFGEIIVYLYNSETICYDKLYSHDAAIAYIDCGNARCDIKVPKCLIINKDISKCTIQLRFSMCLYKDDQFIYSDDIIQHETYFKGICELLKSKIEAKLSKLAKSK